MKLKGTVTDIIFQNAENGYSIVNFAAPDRIFTAVGTFPSIAKGEVLTIEGEFRVNLRFGNQFCVTEVEFSRPEGEDGIIRYLGSGLFKGVGPKLAEAIVRRFGKDTLNVIEKEPWKLRRVGGIGEAKYKDIIDCYNKTRNMRDSILFLQRLDVSMGLAMKIYRTYEDNSVAVVKENPYKMTRDVSGIGFITADKVARKIGIDVHSIARIEAGLIHVLDETAGKSGHTCLPKSDLIKDTVALLNLPEDEVAPVLDGMKGDIEFVTVNDIILAAPSMNFNTENAISAKLLRLNSSPDRVSVDIKSAILDYEKRSGINLHAVQKEALEAVCANGVTVITGGPGTGKTTIIKGVTQIFSGLKKRVLLTAPTGRASKRMTEATGADAKTIHRLLEADMSSGKMKFTFNEKNLLTADVIVVDEISMADIYIFNSLLKAIPTGARLVLVGDKDQLPSVSCGNILHDLIESGRISVVHLTQVYRQAAGSEIVGNAHRINGGQMPVFKDATDFFISRKTDAEEAISDIVGMLKSRIQTFIKVDRRDIQVLSPVKRGLLGVENLNAVLQNALNPDGKEVVLHGSSFRVNDKVMQTVNNYTTEWTRNGVKGTGVFNGDVGLVRTASSSGLEVLFDDGKIVSYGSGDTDQLTLAYCVSVHKAQGSEFPVVIFAASSGSNLLLTRNLLYTAVTRAKKMVVIVGDEENIRKMVRNNYTAKRYSLLQHFLRTNHEKLKLLG